MTARSTVGVVRIPGLDGALAAYVRPRTLPEILRAGRPRGWSCLEGHALGRGCWLPYRPTAAEGWVWRSVCRVCGETSAYKPPVEAVEEEGQR